MQYLLLLIALVGRLNGEEPNSDVVHLTPEQLVQIADQLLIEDIAEVDLDPDTFDVPESRSRKLKKDPLDEIQFM